MEKLTKVINSKEENAVKKEEKDNFCFFLLSEFKDGKEIRGSVNFSLPKDLGSFLLNERSLVASKNFHYYLIAKSLDRTIFKIPIEIPHIGLRLIAGFKFQANQSFFELHYPKNRFKNGELIYAAFAEPIQSSKSKMNYAGIFFFTEEETEDLYVQEFIPSSDIVENETQGDNVLKRNYNAIKRDSMTELSKSVFKNPDLHKKTVEENAYSSLFTPDMKMFIVDGATTPKKQSEEFYSQFNFHQLSEKFFRIAFIHNFSKVSASKPHFPSTAVNLQIGSEMFDYVNALVGLSVLCKKFGENVVFVDFYSHPLNIKRILNVKIIE
jgi:hypothetical protein